MPTFERDILVGAAVEAAFAYLSDFTKHREWTTHDVALSQTSDGPIGAGTTFSSANHMMGRDLQDSIKVLEFVPNERLVYEVEGSTGGFLHTLIFRREGTETHLTKRFETKRLPLLAKLTSPLFFIIAPRALSKDLAAIKRQLETRKQI